MKRAWFRRLSRSTTTRLAASYLAIIMVLSLGFSSVLYKTSSHELGRQIPPPSVFNLDNQSGLNPVKPYHRFFEERIAEAREHLLGRLVILNVAVLIAGAAISYYLARRTLQPIEQAMAAQSRFVADASHELRTPLTAILASNEVALRKPRLTLPQAKEVIASNMEEITQLQGLTDSLLSLANQDQTTLTRQPVSLQDVATEAINRLLPAAQAKHITIDDQMPRLMILGDQAAAMQAVVIVLDNAIKYSPPRSTIYLEGSVQDELGYLSIRDTGIGISQTDLPHIFDRFYRADQARGKGGATGTPGYGIGLSIVRQIIEQHDGKLSVTSGPGEGSTFKLGFPLASPPSAFFNSGSATVAA